jgi:hypothetical protein
MQSEAIYEIRTARGMEERGRTNNEERCKVNIPPRGHKIAGSCMEGYKTCYERSRGRKTGQGPFPITRQNF